MFRCLGTTSSVFCVLALLFLSARCIRADQINLGTISFDVLIPASSSPGTNGFNIFNLTGGANLLPDFPVANDLTFLTSSLLLTGTQPDPSNPSQTIPLSESINLGDIGPGALQDPFGFPPPSLQFPDTFLFTQAELKAKLSTTTFHLADGGVLANGNPYPAGSVFTVNSPSIDVVVTPLNGNNLTAGTDQAVISVSGTVSTHVIPEPASASLLLLLLPWGGAWLYRRQKTRTTRPAA
jgi:hypothetical protein